MANNHQQRYVWAAAETLRNISSQVSGGAARTLEGGHSLVNDLSYDARELDNLAVWQRHVGNTLRLDGKRTTILAKYFSDGDVRTVLGVTLQRSVGGEWNAAALDALIAQAKGAL